MAVSLDVQNKIRSMVQAVGIGTEFMKEMRKFMGAYASAQRASRTISSSESIQKKTGLNSSQLIRVIKQLAAHGMSTYTQKADRDQHYGDLTGEDSLRDIAKEFDVIFEEEKLLLELGVKIADSIVDNVVIGQIEEDTNGSFNLYV